MYSSPSISFRRRRSDDSTGNMTKHVRLCSGTPSGIMDSFMQGSTYNQAHFRFLVARWVAVSHRPYSIVKDPGLVEMIKMLNDKARLPSPATISKDVREVFAKSKTTVSTVLKVCHSHLL